jgi:hypothetical protein
MCGTWILAHICYAFSFALETGRDTFIGQGDGSASGGFLRKDSSGDGKTRRSTMG